MKLIFLFLVILSFEVKGQFREDFTDGDFYVNPSWQGDTGKFEVNSSGQLQLLSSGVDTSILVTANERVRETQWEFWIKLAFNTSANNYARVYLVTDNPFLKGPLNGYFIQVGGSNDSLCFFKQTGTQLNKLFRGNFACTDHSSNLIRIKMIYDSTSNWTLYTDNTGGENYTEEGHCLDESLIYSSWFGVYCQYTSSNSTKFCFDDFYIGPIHSDTLLLTDSILPGDLIINEILTNPLPNGEKFVEIYNRSEKNLNLKEIALGLCDSATNTATGLKPVTSNNVISFPGDYSVLTLDPGDILKRYYCPNPDVFIQMNSIPSIDRETGTLVLARNRDNAIIDRVKYSKQAFSELLTTTRGISLEKINPVLASENISNWHSAAENCGYATPGYRNSEFLNADPGGSEVTLSSSVFTPDDDGKEDVLLMQFKLDVPGYLVNVSIFDAGGNRIRCLAGNRMLSAEDVLIWDGRDEKNQKASIGIYILFFELFRPEGTVLRLKKTCVLGGNR